MLVYLHFKCNWSLLGRAFRLSSLIRVAVRKLFAIVDEMVHRASFSLPAVLWVRELVGRATTDRIERYWVNASRINRPEQSMVFAWRKQEASLSCAPNRPDRGVSAAIVPLIVP